MAERDSWDTISCSSRSMWREPRELGEGGREGGWVGGWEGRKEGRVFKMRISRD